MNIKDEIKSELLDVCLSKLREDLMFDFNNFKYGDYFFKFDNLFFNELKIKLRKSKEFTSTTAYTIKDVKEIIWYFTKDKENKKKIKEIWKLYKKRNAIKKRQKHIKENEDLINGLPESRQKAIYREAKLKRIIR